MGLHGNTFAALTDLFRFLFLKTLRPSLTLLYVVTFESLTLTSFCMKENGNFNVFYGDFG